MTPTHFAPDWAKGIVWYQIFPERLWNGGTSNDPRLEDQAGAWPHDQSPPWQIHPAAEVYAFQRSYDDQRVLVVINRSAQAQPVHLPAGQADRYLDLRNGGEELLVQGGALAVGISPQWGRILLVGQGAP